MDSNPQQVFPSLCSNGCGFFSTTDKDGLCSVCFKEKLKKEGESESSSPATTSSSTQTPPAPETETSVPNTPQASSTSTSIPDLKETTLSESVAENSNIVTSEELASAGSCSASEASETGQSSPRKTPHPGDEDSEPVPAKKPKKNRCVSCKKKLGLTGEAGEMIWGNYFTTKPCLRSRLALTWLQFQDSPADVGDSSALSTVTVTNMTVPSTTRPLGSRRSVRTILRLSPRKSLNYKSVRREPAAF